MINTLALNTFHSLCGDYFKIKTFFFSYLGFGLDLEVKSQHMTVSRAADHRIRGIKCYLNKYTHKHT